MSWRASVATLAWPSVSPASSSSLHPFIPSFLHPFILSFLHPLEMRIPTPVTSVTGRLAAFAVPGPAPLRPANGAAAEKACCLHPPPAAAARFSRDDSIFDAVRPAGRRMPDRGSRDPASPSWREKQASASPVMARPVRRLVVAIRLPRVLLIPSSLHSFIILAWPSVPSPRAPPGVGPWHPAPRPGSENFCFLFRQIVLQ